MDHQHSLQHKQFSAESKEGAANKPNEEKITKVKKIMLTKMKKSLQRVKSALTFEHFTCQNVSQTLCHLLQMQEVEVKLPKNSLILK